jgi:hypothetical protein
MVQPQIVNGGDGLQIWMVAANISKRGNPPAWELGEGLTTPHCKKPACYEMLHMTPELVGTCEHSNETSGFIKGTSHQGSEKSNKLWKEDGGLFLFNKCSCGYCYF